MKRVVLIALLENLVPLVVLSSQIVKIVKQGSRASLVQLVSIVKQDSPASLVQLVKIVKQDSPASLVQLVSIVKQESRAPLVHSVKIAKQDSLSLLPKHQSAKYVALGNTKNVRDKQNAKTVLLESFWTTQLLIRPFIYLKQTVRCVHYIDIHQTMVHAAAKSVQPKPS